jgi:SAM-dependent methyltransferase/acyl carrier protein
MHRSAVELQDLPDKSFDTIVLNSVAQYFPDIEYLLTVLKEAARLVTPGGHIFIGDVRHLGTLPMFHSAVQLSRASATVSVGQLRKRIVHAISQENELVIDPRFFAMLPWHLQGISEVEVQLKRGQGRNELTRYRYDVVLHLGEITHLEREHERIDWSALGSVAELELALEARRWPALHVSSIPNGRLIRDAEAQRLIERSEENVEASAIRRQVSEMNLEELDPETFWQLGNRHAYEAKVSWGKPGCFDVRLIDRARRDSVVMEKAPVAADVQAWRSYATDPLENSLRQLLIPQLREYLKGRLPDFMIPARWVILKEFPLTPNGKLDRKALPAPDNRREEAGEYVAPRTSIERTLAEIWAQVLRVDQVGVQDNFFELGGHSLLATRVMSRVRDSLHVDIALRVLFEAPTVAQLATRIESDNELSQKGNLVRDLQQEIGEMPNDAVLAEIEALEREFGAMEGPASRAAR